MLSLIQSPIGGEGPGVFQQGWSFTEHGKKAEIKLMTNPYDLEAWSVLVREAQVNSAYHTLLYFSKCSLRPEYMYTSVYVMC